MAGLRAPLKGSAATTVPTRMSSFRKSSKAMRGVGAASAMVCSLIEPDAFVLGLHAAGLAARAGVRPPTPAQDSAHQTGCVGNDAIDEGAGVLDIAQRALGAPQPAVQRRHGAGMARVVVLEPDAEH